MKWIALWIISLVALVIIDLTLGLNAKILTPGIVWMGILTFLAIWYGLAPRNIFFTFATEGTAKIVVRGGAFERVLIQLKGNTLDDEGNVVSNGTQKNNKTYTEPRHPFGGLRLYGFWPIWNIYLYRLRWTSVRQDGTASSHDEVLDFILLKEHIYVVKVEMAEDEDMVPLTVILLLTMRVVNPYKAIFRAQDWLEMITGRMVPLFRQYIAENAFKDLIKRKQEARKELWDRIKGTDMIAQFRGDYGIEIKEGGIEMKDISPPEEYQKAATKEYLAEREVDKRAIETIGTVISMMARSRGVEPKDVQKLISRDAGLQKEFLDLSKDLIVRQMGIDGKSYLDVRVIGSGGLEQMLLNLAAAWRAMPGQGEKPKQ